MRTILLCKQGFPHANILAIPAHMHTEIPVCIQQSLCVYDTRLDFLFGNNFILCGDLPMQMYQPYANIPESTLKII